MSRNRPAQYFSQWPSGVLQLTTKVRNFETLPSVISRTVGSIEVIFRYVVELVELYKSYVGHILINLKTS